MQELLYLRQLLAAVIPFSHMDLAAREATPLLMDNAGAICLTRNPAFHKRSKHIDIRYHFVRSYVESGDLNTDYVPTRTMTADALTKPLPGMRHRDLLGRMGLQARETI
jgi:hypothetical protein